MAGQFQDGCLIVGILALLFRGWSDVSAFAYDVNNIVVDIPEVRQNVYTDPRAVSDCHSVGFPPFIPSQNGYCMSPANCTANYGVPVVQSTNTCTGDNVICCSTPNTVVLPSPNNTNLPNVTTPAFPTAPSFPPAPNFTAPTFPPAPNFTAPTFPPAPNFTTPNFPPAPNFTAPTFPPAPNFTTPNFPPAPNFTAPTFPPAPNFTTPNFPPAPNFTTPNFPPAPNFTTPNFPPAPNLTFPAVPAAPNFTVPAIPSAPSPTFPEVPATPNFTAPNVPPAPNFTVPSLPPAPNFTIPSIQNPARSVVFDSGSFPISYSYLYTEHQYNSVEPRVKRQYPQWPSPPPFPAAPNVTYPETPAFPSPPPFPSAPNVTYPQAPAFPSPPPFPPAPNVSYPQAPEFPSPPPYPSAPNVTYPQAPAFPNPPALPAAPNFTYPDPPPVPNAPALPPAPNVTFPQAPALPSPPPFPAAPNVTYPQAPALPNPPPFPAAPNVTYPDAPPLPNPPPFPAAPNVSYPAAPDIPPPPAAPSIPPAPALPNPPAAPNITGQVPALPSLPPPPDIAGVVPALPPVPSTPNITGVVPGLPPVPSTPNITGNVPAVPSVPSAPAVPSVPPAPALPPVPSPPSVAPSPAPSPAPSQAPAFDEPVILPNVVRECKAVTADVVSNFTNPPYPKLTIKPVICQHIVVSQPGYCGLRVRILEASFAPQDGESCSTDSLQIINSLSTPAVPQCGLIAGYQFTVRTEPGLAVTLLVTSQSPKDLWKIQAVQIPCANIKPIDELQAKDCGTKGSHGSEDIEIPVVEEKVKILPALTLLEQEKKTVPLAAKSDDPKVPAELIRKAILRYSQEVKIVRGNVTGVNEWPWQVLLLVNGRPLCGGSLIEDQWVITAGHCVALSLKYPLSSLMVVDVGDHDLRTTSESKNKIYKLEAIVPNIQHGQIANDIALLKLKTKIEPSNTARPVCLPEASDVGRSFEGQTAISTGWGKTEAAVISPILRQAELPILSNEDCRASWGLLGVGGDELILPEMICAGGGDVGPCNGDSGGPLVVQDPKYENKWRLIGLTSFGAVRGCAVPGIPSVYTRITAYLDWISLNLADP